MVLPDFIYVGTGKAGTTWLHKILAKHQAIYVTPVKETNFFTLNYGRGLAWYKKFFDQAPSGAIVGEIDHRYIHDHTLAEKILNDLGKIKIIIGLRRPEDYFLSDYLFVKRNGRFNGGLDAFAQNYFDWETLNYREMINPYLEHFGQENIFIYRFDRLEADPQELLGQLTNFLSVDPMILSPDDFKKVNGAGKARIPKLALIVNRVSKYLKRKNGQKILSYVKKSKLVNFILYQRVTERPIIPDQLASKIREYTSIDIEWIDEIFPEEEFGKFWGQKS